jgi:hypothetical protein
MSKFFKAAIPFDPVANIVTHRSADPLAGKKKEEKAKAEAAAKAAAAGAPSAAGVQKAASLRERIGDIQSAAAAAGAVRSANEADTLGVSARSMAAKKRAASVALLGE